MALELLNEAKGAGIKLDVVIYRSSFGTLLVLFWPPSYSAAPSRLLTSFPLPILPLSSPPPSYLASSAAISACAKAGQVVHALELLETMKKDPLVEPNVVAITAAIAACERSGQWEMALELLDELKNSHTLEPDVVAYSGQV